MPAEKAEKRGPGRGGSPTHVPTAETRRKVRDGVAVGIVQENIARLLGISVVTLHKYYREELDYGFDDLKLKFSSNLFQQVLKEDCPPALIIFVAKTKMGFKEPRDEGEGDNTLRIIVENAPAKVPEEDAED